MGRPGYLGRAELSVSSFKKYDAKSASFHLLKHIDICRVTPYFMLIESKHRGLQMSKVDTRCVAVFTARSPDRVIREGGSQAWVLDANRVRKTPYLVCVQNLHNNDRDFSDATEPHGSVFLVGKISDVVPSDDGDGERWKVEISEFARVKDPTNVWLAWRNPVKYGSLETFGIDLASLTFEPMPNGSKQAGAHRTTVAVAGSDEVAPLSISAAKSGLAAFYGVPQEAIEIVIRG
jgi:hypothetical protein